MLESIKQSWESYRAGVMPADAHPSRVRECRLAFHAGSYAMLMQAAAIGDPHVTEEAGVIHMRSLVDEADRFKRDFLEGDRP